MSQSASPSIPSPAIAVNHLNFFYPSKLALEDINFELAEGSITALVGPNGAGKTTLLRNLSGLDSPYSGTIQIAGHDIADDPRKTHLQIGYLSDDFGLYDDLKVLDVLEFMGGCHNITGSNLTTRIAEVIDLLRLQSVIDKKCSTLSRGWQQRVGIAMSIIHFPKILMLDEPASGLDPEARSELSTILKTLQAKGMTILVSSHILAELEEYCTAMLVLRDGKIQEHVTLSAHQQSQIQIISVALTSPLTPSQSEILQRHFAGQPHTILPNQMSIHFQVETNPNNHHALLKKLLEHDIPVCSFAVEESTLQSLYLQIAHKNS